MQFISLFLTLIAHYAYLIIPTLRGAVTALFRANPTLLAFEAPLEQMLVTSAAAFSPALGTAVDEIFDLSDMTKKTE